RPARGGLLLPELRIWVFLGGHGSLGPMSPSASRLRFALLVLSETLIIGVSFVLAAALRLGPAEFASYEFLLPKAFLSAVVLQLCLYYGDLYEEFASPSFLDLFLRLARAFAAGTLILSLIYFGVPDLLVGRGILLIHLPLAFLGTLAWRQVCLVAWGHEALCESVLVLGTGPGAQHIAREMIRRRPLGFRIAGFLGESPNEVGQPVVGYSVLGTVEDLVAAVKRERTSVIVVALEDFRDRLPVPELLKCRLEGVKVEDLT